MSVLGVQATTAVPGLGGKFRVTAASDMRGEVLPGWREASTTPVTRCGTPTGPCWNDGARLQLALLGIRCDF